VRPARHQGSIVLDPRLTPLPGLPLGPFVRLSDGGVLTVDETGTLVSYDDGKTWKRRPLFSAGQPFKVRPERALLRTRDGTLLLVFIDDSVRKYSWNKQKNLPNEDMHLPSYALRSRDDGRTWQDLHLLCDGWCGCIQDIVQTSNGNIVVPGQELLFKEGRHATIPYVSTDDGKTWRRTRYLDIGGRGDHAGAIEGTLEQLRDGRLWLLLRSYHGFFYESFSPDQGLTWSDPRPSHIRSTGSPGKLKRLASGRLLLVWNALPTTGFKRREELSLSLSEDEGKTWTPPQVVARNKGGRVAYPHVFEIHPGELWLTTMQGGLRCRLREQDFVKRWTKIVAFGDSTTAPRGKLIVYADLLERELPARGVDAWVFNAGVPGDTTEAARRRFRRDVLSREAELVIVQFGINDAAVDVWKNPPASQPRVSLDRYKANLAWFVRTLKEHHIAVILMTPNPLRWAPKTRELYGKTPYLPQDPDGFNVLLTKYADAVRVVARDEHVPLVDIYGAFRHYGEKPGCSIDDLLLDGMHPNDRGQQLVARLLEEKIAEMVKKQPAGDS